MQFWPQKEAIISQTSAPILVTDGRILSLPIKLKIQNNIWAKSQLNHLKMCDMPDCQRHTATMPGTKHCCNLNYLTTDRPIKCCWYIFRILFHTRQYKPHNALSHLFQVHSSLHTQKYGKTTNTKHLPANFLITVAENLSTSQPTFWVMCHILHE